MPMKRSPFAACLLGLALAVPAVAAPIVTAAERAEKARAVEALIRATQAALDRSLADGQAETWEERSARRSLALSRQLLSLGNARVAESMALEAQRVLSGPSTPQARP
jgi:hypothetical protein